MKIAQIVCVLPPYGGGLGTVAHQYADGLVKLGHDVTVILPKTKANLKDSSKKYQVKKLKPLIEIGLGGFIPQILWKARKYDVVHLHFPFFGAALQLALLKLFKGKKQKFILSYHQDLTLKGWQGWYYKFYLKVCVPFILRMADKIVVSSIDYIENSFIKKYYLKNKSKFVSLPFGVPNQFRPEKKSLNLLDKYNLKPEDKIIGFVGGLDSAHYFKGINYLIKAVKILKEQKLNYKALIIGKGNLKESYEKLVKEESLEEFIKFTGYISDKDLPKYYNLMDLVILPSINKAEAFGIVLIEGMGCAKPVIASNLAGVRTVVEEKVNGFLVKKENAQDLANKITQILNNQDLYIKFSQNSLKLVKAKYNWPIIIKKLEEHYKH